MRTEKETAKNKSAENTAAKKTTANTSESKKKKLLAIRQEKEERKRQYEAEQEKMKIFCIVSLGVCCLTLLCLLFPFASVFNTSYGTEVKVNGWSFALACLTGNFSSSSALFGDIAMPFYYYAQSYSVVSGVCSLVALIMIVITAILFVVILPTKAYYLAPIAIVTSFLSFACLGGALVSGLLMNNSQILPVYCQGNSDCSIRSTAWVPMVATAALIGLEIYLCIRHTKAERILHPKRAKKQKAR